VTELECDYLLFVATLTERDELMKAALDLGLTWSRGATDVGEFWKLGEVGSSRVVAVRTRVGSIGPSGSSRNAHHYMALTQATGIISLGMAFGISREEQPVGTVLVSESLFPYDARAVIADPEREGEWRYHYGDHARVYPSQTSLRRIFEQHRARGTFPHAVEFGCLLTGSAVIQSARYRDHLLAWCMKVAPGVRGGEMEGAGFLSLGKRHRPRWIVVKAISDYADEHQGEDVQDHRPQACANAARFVLQALRAWNPREDEV
jgi:nucleoside phosphorylase